VWSVSLLLMVSLPHFISFIKKKRYWVFAFRTALLIIMSLSQFVPELTPGRSPVNVREIEIVSMFGIVSVLRIFLVSCSE
jgi:hypothetical protein